MFHKQGLHLSCKQRFSDGVGETRVHAERPGCRNLHAAKLTLSASPSAKRRHVRYDRLERDKIRRRVQRARAQIGRRVKEEQNQRSSEPSYPGPAGRRPVPVNTG